MTPERHKACGFTLRVIPTTVATFPITICPCCDRADVIPNMNIYTPIRLAAPPSDSDVIKDAQRQLGLESE